MSACSYCGATGVPTSPAAFICDNEAMATTTRMTCRACLVEAARSIQERALTCGACMQLVGPTLAAILAFDAAVDSGQASMVKVPPVLGRHEVDCPFAGV